MVVQQAVVSECGPPRGRHRASFPQQEPVGDRRRGSVTIARGPGCQRLAMCRPRKSPATCGSAPPSSRHTRYDARPRVKVTGVLSPERGPRDTKGARGGIPDEAAGYSGIPQLSANLRDRNRRIRWGIERVLRRNGLNQVNPVHLRDRVAFCVAGPRNHERRGVSGRECR
jgi:hypothetical protein